jgi:hypothetical protein
MNDPSLNHNDPADELLAEAGSTTRKVDEAADKINRELMLAPPVELQSDTIALYMMDDERPVILKDRKEILMGRYSDDETESLFDVTPYRGDLFGVSRRHAVIRKSTKNYTIEDLGSTNGTWINESKIAPFIPYDLQNGDYVRLGQMTIRIYFNAELSNEEIFYLKDVDGPIRLTPQKVTGEILPLIAVLMEIQKVADELANRKHNEVIIHSLAVTPQGMVKVKLEGGGQALEFARGKVNVWRSKFRTLETPALNAQDEIKGGNLSLDSSAFRRQLVLDFLVQFPLNNLGEAQRSAYVERLLPYFKTLTTTALEITTGNGS